MAETDWLLLSAAAMKLKWTLYRTRTSIILGDLPGEFRDGRWYVRADAVEALARERPNGDAPRRGNAVGKR